MRELWVKFFLKKPANFVSLSACARVALYVPQKATQVFDGTPSERSKKIIGLYNKVIAKSIDLTPAKPTKLSEKVKEFYNKKLDIGTIKAYLEDVAYHGGFYDCPDFVFAVAVIKFFPMYIVEEFSTWTKKSEEFVYGSEESWPLLRFLLTAKPGEDLLLLRDGGMFLACENIFRAMAEIQPVLTELSQHDADSSLRIFANKWMII